MEESNRKFYDFRLSQTQTKSLAERFRNDDMSTNTLVIAVLHNQSLIIEMLTELTNKEIKKVE